LLTSNLAGTTILHYRILRAIGSGGMGVVYEAEDTKLGRRVALKFLPPELAADPAALERFAREARAASALNHPNICTIHAIEEADGARFIAMELLDGESLDRRIASRPLAWDALADTGLQITDALDAAHRRGIIHRDIKPANVFLTTDGRAKVLDFGVAKMALPHVAQAETIGGATAQQALTGVGATVGTIAYMSPEQARGEELDARTDLFSLAAVLYEMSTGRRAFDGQTSAVIFSRILEGTPDPPREINPTLPPKLEDVILRGLEKDRDLRYQSAADLRADLKRLKRDASAGRLAFVPPVAGSGVTVPLSSGAVLAAEARRHKGLAGVAALAVLALTAAAGYGVFSLVRSSAPTPAPTAEPVAVKGTPARLTTSGDVAGCGSISPDGKYFVYCDFAGRLNVLQVTTGAMVRIADEGGDTTFSPDSTLVYVSVRNDTNPEGVLHVIPSLGGEPRRIVKGIAGAVGVSPDGQRIAFVRFNAAQRESALIIADARGGNERRLAVSSTDDSWFAELGVSWSHDGTRLSATQATVVGGYRMRPVVIHADTGEIETPGSRTWAELGRTAWLPDNTAILFTAADRLASGYQFWMVRYPDGAPMQITTDSRGFDNNSVSVTADGSTAATVPNDVVSNLWSTNPDATAPLEQWTSGARMDGSAGIEPRLDGRVFYTSWDGSDMGVWSIDAPGARPRRLTPQYGDVPSAPDDGRFVAFQALHENRFRIWRMEPDGSDARVLSRGEDDIAPMVSPDGRWIYYWAAAEKGTIMRMAADGSGSSVLTDLPVAPVSVSPDGRELLVRSQHISIGASHAVLDAETGAIKARVDLPGDARAGWGHRGDRLTYILHSGGVGNLWEQPIAGGPPRQLTRFTSGRIFNFAYTPDRQRLFIARGHITGDVWLFRDFR
jgi:Tol biopolymer transport system component/tRNA A-37 threonylcarbamoyl transferase component Bud32